MTYTYKAHSSAKRFKAIPWFVCRDCGLIYLNNDFTRWAIRMGCNNRDHPDEARQREKAGRLRGV